MIYTVAGVGFEDGLPLVILDPHLVICAPLLHVMPGLPPVNIPLPWNEGITRGEEYIMLVSIWS